MIVVSDTSPLTNLMQIGQLALLKYVFGKVIITEAVYEELCQLPEQKSILEKQGWIRFQKVPDNLEIQFNNVLDKGEAESIALAIHLNADYLLIDEARGRAVAEELGLKIVGLLGILIKAKAMGFIKAVKPLLDALMIEAGFYIHEELYKKVLLFADES